MPGMTQAAGEPADSSSEPEFDQETPQTHRRKPSKPADVGGKDSPQPRLGFIGSILYGLSKILDSVWSGGSRMISTFKDLTQGQAMVAVLAITMVLVALGATASICVMGYVCYAVVNRPSSEADANAALLKFMNERDDRILLEKERDQARQHAKEIKQETRETQRDLQQIENNKQIARLVESNDKIARTLESMNNKLPGPIAPMPHGKAGGTGE